MEKYDPTDDDAIESRETAYLARNEAIQHTIDVLASYPATRLEEFGAKAEIAREHDLERHRVDYVLSNWAELVKYRRNANADPLDANAVKAAYDDPTLAKMAGGGEKEAYECPDCGKAFDTNRQLRGHLGGQQCERPEGWTMEDARTTVPTPPQPVADGAGDIQVDITLTLDEVFRAVKLLPGDLGLKVYGQTLSSEFSRAEVRSLLGWDDEA